MPVSDWGSSGGKSSSGGSSASGGSSTKTPPTKAAALTTQLGKKGVTPQQIGQAQQFIQKFQQGSGLTGFADRFANDVSNTVSNAPRGLVGFGTGLVQEAKTAVKNTDWTDPAEYAKLALLPTGVPEVAFLANQTSKAVGGPSPLPNLLPNAALKGNQALGAGFFNDASKQQLKDNPVLTGQGASFRQTADRITNPGQALKDYSSHPFSSLVNDAANLSLVAAPAAGAASDALEAAGHPVAANAIRTSLAATEKAGQGPFIPTSLAARGLNKGLTALAEKVAPADGAIQTALSRVGLGTQAGQVRDAIHQGKSQIPTELGPIVKSAKAQEDLVGTPAEQMAMREIASGGAKTLATVRAANPEGFDQYVKSTYTPVKNQADQLAKTATDLRHTADIAQQVADKNPGDQFKATQAFWADHKATVAEDAVKSAGPRSGAVATLTPEAAHLAADVVEGHNPELADRIQQAIGVHQQALTAPTGRETGYLSREVPSGSRAAQTKPQLLPLSVKPVEQKANVLARQAVVARETATNARTVANLTPEDTKLGLKADVAERKATKAETMARAGQLQLKQTKASVEAAPAAYRPGIAAAKTANTALVKHAQEIEKLGDIEGGKAVRQMAKELPTTMDKMVKAGVNPDHFINVTDDAKLSKGLFGTKASVKGANTQSGESMFRKENLMFDRTIPAQARAEYRRAAGVIKSDVATQLQSMPFAGRLGDRNSPLANVKTFAEAKSRGYSPILKDGETGVTENTSYVPTQVLKSFDTQFGPKNTNPILSVYDKGTRVFKTSVLALSPSWQVNRTIGHAVMAMAGGGVDPLTLANNIRKVVSEYRQTGEFHGPSALRGRNANASDYEYITPRIPGETGKLNAAKTVLGAVPRASYRLSNFLDNTMRSAVYMAKEQAGHSPELALRESLRAMGDFTKMNPFEQDVVRRVFPFYAWQKHITKLAFSLPIEHPIRTAWMASLANQYGQPEAWVRGLPSYLQSLVPLGGGQALTPGHIMPFPINPLENFTPTGAEYATNPFIKIAASATGKNFNTGQDFTSRPGTATDEFGKVKTVIPSLSQQVRTTLPQLKLLDSLTGRDDVARYNSGQTVLTTDPKTGKRVPIPTPQNHTKNLMDFLGVRLAKTKDLQAEAASIEAKKLKAIAASEKYSQVRSSVAKKATVSAGASSSKSSSGVSDWSKK